MKFGKVAFKTDKQCEEEIDSIISGKNKSPAAWVVRRWITNRKLIEPMESIRANLIKEMITKYGDLQTGRKSADQILKESKAELEASGTKL